MRYMLLCYHDEKIWETAGEGALQKARAEAVERIHELDANGQYLISSPLQPISTATSVRIRDGKRLVTDGPFAETKEQLAGFYLIDAKDLNEAISIAARQPGARLGTIEVRPVWELEGLPPPRLSSVATSIH